MKTKNTHPIPSKLSALIIVALGDLERAEKSQRHFVLMYKFHGIPRAMGDCTCEVCSATRKNEGKCAVCFAGAVIAFGLGADPEEDCGPSDFPKYEDQLEALDRIRIGHLDGERFDVTPYEEDPAHWKLEMVLTARALEEIGQ